MGGEFDGHPLLLRTAPFTIETKGTILMERYLALKNVLETGGFTKAAKAMGYSQSSDHT